MSDFKLPDVPGMSYTVESLERALSSNASIFKLKNLRMGATVPKKDDFVAALIDDGKVFTKDFNGKLQKHSNAVFDLADASDTELRSTPYAHKVMALKDVLAPHALALVPDFMHHRIGVVFDPTSRKEDGVASIHIAKTPGEEIDSGYKYMVHMNIANEPIRYGSSADPELFDPVSTLFHELQHAIDYEVGEEAYGDNPVKYADDSKEVAYQKYAANPGEVRARKASRIWPELLYDAVVAANAKKTARTGVTGAHDAPQQATGPIHVKGYTERRQGHVVAMRPSVRKRSTR